MEAFYGGETWDELTGCKASEKSILFLRGWEDAKEENKTKNL